jgi:hypothetical protein
MFLYFENARYRDIILATCSQFISGLTNCLAFRTKTL